MLDSTEIAESKRMILQMENDYSQCVCVLSKQAISKARQELQEKIEEAERRLNASLRKQVVDGVEIEIPESMSEYNGLKFHVHEGILYLIEREKSFSKYQFHKGTEFNWHSYVWIPNGNKFSKLCVRMLGGDCYGDRIFCSVTHYKHPSDWHSYMETVLRIDNYFYRPYVEHILQEVTGWTLKVLKRT